MAKKRRRTVTRRSSDVDAVDEQEEEGEWEEDTGEEAEQTVAPKPAAPQMMVTWNGEAGASKQWYGITFEAGVPQAVGHTAHWASMRQAIDANRGGAWSYEYVVEAA